MMALEEVGSFSDVRIDITVELDRRSMSIREILALDVGNIITMPRSAGENLEIHVGGSLVGYGEIVIIESSMGFRITDFKTEE